MSNTEEKKYYVTRVEWTEHERGWGQRFDGYSYHLNEEYAKKYIREFIATISGPAPYCYVSPGTPRIIQVDPLFAMLVYDKEILWDDKNHETLDDKF